MPEKIRQLRPGRSHGTGGHLANGKHPVIFAENGQVPVNLLVLGRNIDGVDGEEQQEEHTEGGGHHQKDKLFSQFPEHWVSSSL